ncbi:hypothetical protein [Nocardioides zhouii]|uniref:Lipoprotein n=1 Tax=Nocardioides zhouii TaxID=1168729 RepID=A0A4Q2SHD0_9ACTN|nr:hypothetical protein [Nocardioides zhouii]RYC03314.1 hypothetical protein EUA94_21845 [Nocardioides zhouii]
MRLRSLFVLVLVVGLAGCTARTPREVVTSSSVSDASGDVVVGGLGKDRATVVTAPENTITDILETTVDHGSDALTVEVVFEDLRPQQYLDLTASLRTDSTGSGLPTQASALTYRGDSSIDVYRDGTARCTGADAGTVAIDFDTDTVTMTVPRSCLGEPRWIEAQVRAATMHYDASPDDPRADAVWEDDAYAPALEQPSDRRTSPRLYHP